MKMRIFLLALIAMTVNVYAKPSANKILKESGVTGGIAVHIGCGDGKLTAALHTSDRLLVHGLDTDENNVKKAKAYIDSLGIYGKVWAEKFDGKNLPHGDNTINLIVVSDKECEVSEEEINRVLAPRGVAIIGRKKIVKPVPAEIDDWTHFLYNASGNAVSKDKKVGHPRSLQWYAGPARTRHHDALASMSAMTSSGGRIFYIYDEGPVSIVHRPSQWKLIARDAFNGKLLWKRDIPTWMTHLYNFRAGPKQLPRRLVSVGNDVFVTLGFTAPVTKLDAATGETLLTYKDSDKAEEVIYHNGMLLVVKGDASILIDKADGVHGYWEMAEYEEPEVEKSIIAYDAEKGKELWRIKGDNLKHLVPLSLSAADERIFYLDNKLLHCIDTKNGNELWTAPFETLGLFIRAYSPTVAIHRDIIMCLIWNKIHAFSVVDGKKLWENKGSMGFGAPADLFAIGDKVWCTPLYKSIWKEDKRDKDGVITTGINIPKTNFLNEAKNGVGIDIETGKVVEELPFAHNQHHHRCYRDKATEKYILIGHSGIQLVDPITKKGAVNQWVRGLCQYGIMPANGYIYVPPDPCRCYGTTKINGFFALTERNSFENTNKRPGMEKGSAYAKAAQVSTPSTESPEDWPTYRGNIKRSGSSTSEVPAKLEEKWSVDIGEGITAPVIASNRVYVAKKNAYTVYCLDRNSGKQIWKFLGNGPIDTPPTIYGELCVFGSGDGSVYCLDVATGELAWRFKASRVERRVGSDNRLESPLPISGSVLVMNDIVYFAAGRSSHLDGGIRLYGVDIKTGKPLHIYTVASGYWGNTVTPELTSPHKNLRGPKGSLVDILVSNGESITMRNITLTKDLKAGASGNAISTSKGFLDDSWFHRTTWRFTKTAGQLVVHDDNVSYGVNNLYTGLKGSRKGQFEKYNQVGHLHQKFSRYEEDFFPVGTKISAMPTINRKKETTYKPWTISEKFQPRAMVLAGKNLFVAGWLDDMVIELKSGRPKDISNPDPRDSVIRVYSAQDGKRIAEHKLEAEPVFDGMAAANGELYISTENGKIICFK